MTTRGKAVLTFLILGLFAFSAWKWWERLAPRPAPPVSATTPAVSDGNRGPANPARAAVPAPDTSAAAPPAEAGTPPAGEAVTLGLAYGAPFPQVKAAYKKLLMQHHPDRNGGSAESQKRATELSAKINAAYQRIETWTTTGKLPEEG